jgi:cell division protein FtsL
MRDTQQTAEALESAAREIRRARTAQWSKWEKVGLFLFATITTTCAVIGALAAVL